MKEDGPNVEALDIQEWDRSMRQRQDREEAEGRRRRRRRKGLGKDDSEELDLLPADEALVSSNFDSEQSI